MEENKFLKINIFIKSFFISIFLTMFGLFVLSIFLCYSNVSEKIVDSTLIMISSISIMLGCIFFEKKLKSKGLLYGSAFGAIYIVGIYFISSFVGGDFSIGINSIIMMLMGIFSGAIGGIIGVNFFK